MVWSFHICSRARVGTSVYMGGRKSFWLMSCNGSEIVQNQYEGMIVLEIKRDRFSDNGAVSRGSFERIAEFRDVAAEYFLSYLREVRKIEGERSTTQIVARNQLPAEPAVYFANSSSDEFFIDTTQARYEDRVITTVFDLETRLGVQYQKYADGELEDEFYELDDSRRFTHFATIWVPELFDPGSRPEYAELAELARVELIDPQSLPIVTAKAFGSHTMSARASLSKLELPQFAGLLRVYNEVAYPSGTSRDSVGSLLKHYYDDLKGGETVGLRSGTEYVGCAKHLLYPERREDYFETSLYLNYDIGVCGVNLYFREDLAMERDFAIAASEYFAEEGISCP